MFVLLRIRKGCSIIKDWYGVKRACENLTFVDLFDEFRNGTLDSSTPIDINSSVLSVFVGPKKTELTQLSPDVCIGVSILKAIDHLVIAYSWDDETRTMLSFDEKYTHDSKG